MDLNKVMIIGRLTRDPELRSIPNGSSVANFAVATNRVYTDKTGTKQETVEYHDIVAWQRLAEICAQYLGKGKRVYIEGRLQTRSWDDPNGFKRYKTEITAENMIMLDAPSNQPAMQARNQKTFSKNSSNAQTNNTTKNTGPASTPPSTKKPSSTPPDLPTIDVSEPTQGSKDEEEMSVEDIPF